MKNRLLSLYSGFGLNDVLVVVGFGCIVAGIGLIYPPAALITFGIGLLLAGIMLAKGGK